jgi:hypothetical protein
MFLRAHGISILKDNIQDIKRENKGGAATVDKVMDINVICKALKGSDVRSRALPPINNYRIAALGLQPDRIIIFPSILIIRRPAGLLIIAVCRDIDGCSRFYREGHIFFQPYISRDMDLIVPYLIF